MNTLEEKTKENAGNKAISRRETTPTIWSEETEQAVTVQLELPGVQEKDIELNVDNHILTVIAENDIPVFDGFTLVLREIPEIRYRASFELPEKIDESKIKAALKNGILTLTLPKVEAVKPKKFSIPIQQEG